MPIWSEILEELNNSEGGINNNLDNVRRKYLFNLQNKTKRNVILYASAWLQRPDANSNAVMINDEDIQALMEVTYQLKGTDLDLILHSPGGSPEATEAIVSYLRCKFRNIRVIVPQIAMSAATMVACSANTVMLGKHSSLGPIDPQIVIPTGLGVRTVAAQHVLNQFDLAKEQCEKPENLIAWAPILTQYGPDLLIRCETVKKLAQELSKTWLATYMFAGEIDSQSKAESISCWLADHDNFKSHSRHIFRAEAEEQGINIESLENDQELQDLVLSVFHATTHTFTHSTVIKIVENHEGRAYMKMQPTI